MGDVTYIICSMLWDISKQESLADAKVAHDKQCVYEGLYGTYLSSTRNPTVKTAKGTNLSSTRNPTVKTAKAIPRYVIKPLTYLFHRLTCARVCLYIRCSVVMTTDLVRACWSLRYVINSAVIDWLRGLCWPRSSETRYSRVLVDNRYPLVFGAPFRGLAVRFTQQPLVTKN